MTLAFGGCRLDILILFYDMIYMCWWNGMYMMIWYIHNDIWYEDSFTVKMWWIFVICLLDIRNDDELLILLRVLIRAFAELCNGRAHLVPPIGLIRYFGSHPPYSLHPSLFFKTFFFWCKNKFHLASLKILLPFINYLKW